MVDINRKTRIYVPSLSDSLDMESYNTLKKAKIPVEAMPHYRDAMDRKKPFFKRVGAFLTAQTKAGRKAKIFKDAILTLVPFGKQVSNLTELATHIIEPKRAEKPMLEKIKSVKGFIKMKDEDGNIDWEQLAASVIQFVIAGAIVYGAIALGVWEGLTKLFSME